MDAEKENIERHKNMENYIKAKSKIFLPIKRDKIREIIKINIMIILDEKISILLVR